jgi:hypothetical protein
VKYGCLHQRLSERAHKPGLIATDKRTGVPQARQDVTCDQEMTIPARVITDMRMTRPAMDE